MATIKDLEKSITEMSTGELMDKIKSRRRSRFEAKRKPKKQRATKPKVPADPNKLTAEQAAELLKTLTGG